jgi:thioredoxin-like negative regulator of GroEL
MELLKFGASWCLPCKNLSSRLDKMSLSITLHSYDVEEEVELTEKWKVRNVPTVSLVADDNNEVKRWVGNFEPNVELKAFIKNG